MASVIVNISDSVYIRDNWYTEAPFNPTHNIHDAVHISDSWSRKVENFSVNIADSLTIRDNWHKAIDDNDTKSINETVVISDNWAFNILDFNALAINDTVVISDNWKKHLVAANTVEIDDNVYISDSWEHEVFFSRLVNQNITFGETKETGYKEYSHRFRWTNYNGQAVPDLNYKDLKEPIVRMMPAPSFLQFEYANSFLLFTRNSINRFVLKADVDTGEWRAQTDNLIEEFKDLGLMEPKSLVLAGDTLFGLSEKGVWKWNKNGMELISDKIIDLPDAGVYEYIAFYSSIRNQYILHRQESSGSYLQLVHGTPVAAPSYTGSSALSRAKTVMLTDTKFVISSFIDTNTARMNVGDIDVIAQSVTYGASYGVGGETFSNIRTSLIAMGNGAAFVHTYDHSGTPRKVVGGTVAGTVISFGTLVDVVYGNYLGGVLIKFTETTFACITADSGEYQTGSLAGADVTLNSGQSSGISYDRMKSIYIGNGISVIAYVTYGANIFVRTVEDNGDGTINLGTALDTGITINNGELDIIAASSTLILLAASSTNDLKTIPLILTGTTLTKGTIKTKTGYFDNTNMDLAIANKGSSGMWLFFEDARNSNYLTVMWGSVSPTEIIMAESITEVVQDYKTYSVVADAVVGGFGLLHYNEGDGLTDDGYTSVWGLEYAQIDSFVYQIDRKKWGKFLGMDILDVPVILSGGSLDENYNLWLDSDRELKKYPGTAYTAVEAVIRTKEFYIEKGAFQRWMVDFEGSSVNVESRVNKMVSGSKVSEEDIKYSVTPNKWRGISLDKQRGYEMSIKIIDADIIKGLSFDSKKWGEQ